MSIKNSKNNAIISFGKRTNGGIPPPFSDLRGYTENPLSGGARGRPKPLRTRIWCVASTLRNHAEHVQKPLRIFRLIFRPNSTEAHTGPTACPRLSDVPGGIPRQLYYFYLLPPFVHHLPPFVQKYAPLCPKASPICPRLGALHHTSTSSLTNPNRRTAELRIDSRLETWRPAINQPTLTLPTLNAHTAAQQ